MEGKMHLPNLNALRAFEAAARHLNFRLAAEELHVTQGAVAQQVRKLEADLGQPLFTRQARGLALTEAGRSYQVPVRRALEVISEATARLQARDPGVTLSLTPSLAAKWLVPRLADFAEAHPGIELRLLASERLADFERDGVDIAIRQGAAPAQADWQVRFLAPMRLTAYCSPEVAARLPDAGGLADLAALPLLQDGHGAWERLLGQAGLRAARPLMRFNQTALALDAAAGGQGVALALELLAAADVAAGRLVPVWRDDGPAPGGFHVIWPSQPESPVRAAVAGWLLAQAARPD